MAWDVVIAGGGFGGYYAARTLERTLPPHSARITLVNDANFFLYTPLLPGASGGTLEPRHVVVPLREELDHTDVRLARVTGLAPDRRRLAVRTLEGRDEEIAYDQLVVALGSVSKTLPIDGLSENAIGFKTLSEGIALRNHAIETLEIAESIDDPLQRAGYLTYMFVGGGYAGLEGLAELQDFLADVIDLYPRCRMQGMRWILVEARDRVMYEVPPDLAEFATRELRGRGIEVRTQTTVESATDHGVQLSTGETVPTRTLAWTAGVRPHPVVDRLGLPLDSGGRIRTDACLRVEGHDGVWAIGDAAAVPDPSSDGNKPCPPTAQHAVRQGRLVGHNVAATLGAGRRVRPFTYKSLGVFVDLGRHQAVASTMGVKWRGFPAWFLARTYHLATMPGAKRKLRLVADWTVGLGFRRNTSELGQLGHPPTLGDESLTEQSAGGTVVRDGEVGAVPDAAGTTSGASSQ